MTSFALSEVTTITELVVKHAADAFLGPERIAAEWRDLNFTAAPDYARALDEYAHLLELCGRGGAMIRCLPPGEGVGLDSIYVRDASKPLVATADGALLNELRKSPDDYRRKNVFGFNRYSTDRIELTRDGQAIVFEKVKSQDVTPDMGPLEVAPGTQWDDGREWKHQMFPPEALWPGYAQRGSRKCPQAGDISCRSALTLHRGTEHSN